MAPTMAPPSARNVDIRGSIRGWSAAAIRRLNRSPAMCSTSSSVLTSLNCLGIANAPKFQQSWLRDTHRGGQPYQRKAWSVFLATWFWSVMVHGQPTDRTLLPNTATAGGPQRRFFMKKLVIALTVLLFWAGSLHGTSPLNRIQQENRQPGTTAWQLTSPADNRQIEGYASLTSVPVGGNISLFVNTQDKTYSLTVYRMGWYGGKGRS